MDLLNENIGQSSFERGGGGGDRRHAQRLRMKLYFSVRVSVIYLFSYIQSNIFTVILKGMILNFKLDMRSFLLICSCAGIRAWYQNSFFFFQICRNS